MICTMCTVRDEPHATIGAQRPLLLSYYIITVCFPLFIGYYLLSTRIITSANSVLVASMTFIHIELVVGYIVEIGYTLQISLGDVGVEPLHFS